jgi:hypothetical protein
VGSPDLARKYQEIADVLSDPLVASYLPGLQSPLLEVSGKAYHAIEAYRDQKAKAGLWRKLVEVDTHFFHCFQFLLEEGDLLCRSVLAFDPTMHEVRVYAKGVMLSPD